MVQSFHGPLEIQRQTDEATEHCVKIFIGGNF